MNTELIRFNNDLKFLVFDFETEDLNLYTSKPWQYGSILGTSKKTISENDTYIRWPNLNISKEAETITRFDKAYWEKVGRDPKEVLEEINEEFEEADYVCGHNILAFDIEIYRRYCARYKVTPVAIHRKAIDTFACGKGIKAEIPYKRGENFLHYQLKMLNFIIHKRGFATLAALAKLYDIEVDTTKTHNALYDVQLNREVLLKMLWQIEL